MRITKLSKPDQNKINTLKESLNIDQVIATLLLQRGISTYEEARLFFRPKIEDLHNPFLMKDMDKAVDRVLKAIHNNEKILVYGDYDVDGTTAVALVSSFLKKYSDFITTYIPDRYLEGYGISYTGIDYAHDNEVTLIIALDCGIKSVEHIAYATEKGIDFIICDHHRPGNELPKAIAVLDPKRDDCNYPYDELCGCGIGFKLIQAIAQKEHISVEKLMPFLDLVAIAIGADIVPITGENRIFAKFGLEIINSNPRPGVNALMQSIKKKKLTINEVVFIIAPRINAAGRIKHGNYAVALLTEFDNEQALIAAQEIESFNIERKELDKQITYEALEQIKKNKEELHKTTVVFQENWHKGVIGIVASRLTETYYRPTLVFTKSEGKLAASARSVKDFDIYEALEYCKEHIIQFGGHKYAAGLTLEEQEYIAFKNKFEEVVSKTINPDLLQPEIVVDCEINFSDITPKFLKILKQFEPFGPQNMTPVFLTSQVFDTGYGKKMGANDEHLKLFVKQKNNQENAFSAIGFTMGELLEETVDRKLFTLLYSIDENEFNNETTVQLRVRAIV